MKKAPKKFITKRKEEITDKSGDKAAQARKSPRISRMIPEIASITLAGLATIRTHGVVIFISFFCGVLLIGIGVVAMDFQKNLKELERREVLHKALSGYQKYWVGIVAKYPDYKDAYFQLAVVSYQLGETMEAKRAIGKVLEIDPNDTTGQEFEKKIRS